MSKFHESQYSILTDNKAKYGAVKLGIMSSYTRNNDPKRLVFVLSRYKAVSSILSGEDRVLEIGCGDSFASRIVCQSVNELTVTDIDPEMIKNARDKQ